MRAVYRPDRAVARTLVQRRVALLVVALGALTVRPMSAQEVPTTDIQRAVDHYLDGQRSGSPDQMLHAFHPNARIMFITSDTLGSLGTPDFARRFSGKAPADSLTRQVWIAAIDVTGRAAAARVEIIEAAGHVTDYLTLLRLGTGWTIVAKATNFVPRVPPTTVGTTMGASTNTATNPLTTAPPSKP